MAYKYTPPKWLGCIPQGTHGSSIIQRKYWKVVSDFVRIRDFYDYGICISCNRKPENWNIKEWQACHYHPYSVCRGYSKFSIENIFGGCGYCNSGFGGAPVGINFRNGILKRYGNERLKLLDKFQSLPSEKMEDFEIVKKIKDVILLMKDLKEKPDYYQKIIKNKTFML